MTNPSLKTDYHGGELSALFCRLILWYITAFLGVMVVGSLINEFWFSAALSLLVTLLLLPPMRRRLQSIKHAYINENWKILCSTFLTLSALVVLCEWELTKRIDEFDSRRAEILTRAEEALESEDYSTVYSMARRYAVLPNQPLAKITTKAQIEQLNGKKHLEDLTDAFIDQYRRQIYSLDDESEFSSEDQ
ncbi:MAG: hypothetical protein ACX931_02490 [Saccharospirillum sp.]